jgi:hypothetical protein
MFVDESKRGSRFLLAAVLVPSGALARVRAEIRGDLLKGQRRIHFIDERNERRKQLIQRWVSLRTESAVFVIEGVSYKAEAAAREACLRQVVAVARKEQVSRLVIESREGQDQADRRLLRKLVEPATDLTYEHLRPHEEPLLWYADGVAWCWGAGGAFRQPLEESKGFHLYACGS